MISAPLIKALSPWYGCKRRLASTIIEEIGDHKAYWEPFCGSMAVLLAKPESRMETVNDLHSDLINLARVIKHQQHGPMLYRRARRLITSDDLLAEYDAAIRESEMEGDEPDVERALAFFVTSWMGRNGEVGLQKNERGRGLAVRWTPNGGDPATRYASAVSSISAWRRRLRNVTVLRRDAFLVIGKLGDDAGTVIYCDPPYLHKSDRYLHDFNDGFMGQANDHERLATALHRFKRARVVVSYYDHPLLAQLYPDWTKRLMPVSKGIVNQAKRGQMAEAAMAPEVLLINGPSLAKGAA